MAFANETHRRERPPRFLPFALGIGAGAIILLVLLFVFPIEWSEAKNRFRFWRAGARPVLWEKHRGFELNRCGTAPPSECRCVWLVHGFGDSVSTWRRFFLDEDAFGKTPVHLFALDLPAHGGSLRRKNLEEYRASAMARELDAGIAGTKDCSRNILIGNSMGGWITTLMVLEDSTRPKKQYENLFLLSPGGVKRADEETKGLFTENTVETLKEFQRRAYYQPRELPDSVWKKAAERMGKESLSEVRSAQVEADRLDGKLSRISTPTTVIWGEADRILSKDVMNVFVSGIPGARFVSLPKCGHLPQKECPDPLFRAIQSAL